MSWSVVKMGAGQWDRFGQSGWDQIYGMDVMLSVTCLDWAVVLTYICLFD